MRVSRNAGLTVKLGKGCQELFVFVFRTGAPTLYMEDTYIDYQDIYQEGFFYWSPRIVDRTQTYVLSDK